MVGSRARRRVEAHLAASAADDQLRRRPRTRAADPLDFWPASSAPNDGRPEPVVAELGDVNGNDNSGVDCTKCRDAPLAGGVARTTAERRGRCACSSRAPSRSETPRRTLTSRGTSQRAGTVQRALRGTETLGAGTRCRRRLRRVSRRRCSSARREKGAASLSPPRHSRSTRTL